MDRKAQLINQIKSALREKPERENYCIGYEGKLYKLDDIDFSSMRPNPGAKGIPNTRIGEVYSISGVQIFF